MYEAWTAKITSSKEGPIGRFFLRSNQILGIKILQLKLRYITSYQEKFDMGWHLLTGNLIIL